jgi:hypothetical protein
VKGKLNTFRSVGRLFERAQKQLLIARAIQTKSQLKPPDPSFRAPQVRRPADRGEDFGGEMLGDPIVLTLPEASLAGVLVDYLNALRNSC